MSETNVQADETVFGYPVSGRDSQVEVLRELVEDNVDGRRTLELIALMLNGQLEGWQRIRESLTGPTPEEWAARTDHEYRTAALLADIFNRACAAEAPPASVLDS